MNARRVVKALRTVRAAAQVVLEPRLMWRPPGHFYSPILGMKDRQKVIERRSVPHELPGIDLRPKEQFQLIEDLAAYYQDLPFTPAPNGLRYFYENSFYSYADGILYACMLRHFRPARMVEVGSGYSSALALDINDRFLGGGTDLVFVDPFPTVLRKVVTPADLDGRLVQRPLQEVPLDLFASLRANDILFIDSTHVSRTGSDVNYLVFEVIPSLAKGVLVHFHDIHYPFDYPDKWVLEGRSWNEAYILRSFLQFNTDFQILLFNTYLERIHEVWFRQHMPLCLRDRGGSIWLRRVE